MVDSVPPLEFADAHRARLAYQVWGEGPNIVAIPPLAQNIEMAWEWPAVASMLRRFGTFSRYLHFDKRGTGCSDRRSAVPGLDERVEDIRAVMDAAGLDRAHFYVCSDGGPMALMFAASYPDRVQSLVFFNSFASQFPEAPSPSRRAELSARARELSLLWGTPDSPWVDTFAPSLAHDVEFRSWHQRYERNSATPESLVDLFELTIDMDTTEILDRIEAPTLVIHRVGDRVVPVERGRDIAARVPNARIVELESDDHFAYVGDIESWMVEVESFVTGGVADRVSPRRRTTTRIRTLGGFVVERDGDDIPSSEWGSRRARQLCKRLVLARGWPVTRDELFDLLWPDEADRSRLGSRLSVQLSTVRRILDGGVIADRDTVRLDLDAVSTDIEDFHAADARGRIALYRGELLPEDRWDDWTDAPRRELRALFLDAADHIAAVDRGRGAFEATADLARRMIDADPHDERGHRLLIATLNAAGSTSAAHAAHDAYVAAMDDLGVVAASWAVIVDRKVF